jgi:hypothetical protein
MTTLITTDKIVHKGMCYHYIRSNVAQVILKITGATLPEENVGYRYENRTN